MNQNLKVPPHNLEAEAAVLSCMLINPGCRPQARLELTATDFYREAHSLLFPVIASDGLDLIGILDKLGKKDILEKCGSQDYIASLAESQSSSASIAYYIEIVKEYSRQRQILNLLHNAFSQSGPSEEVAGFIRKRLNEIDTRDQSGFRPGVDIANVYDAEKCLKEYARYIETLGQNRLITGIYNIDKQIRGVAGGEVLFIIARSGSYKTAFLQNILKNYINHSAWGSVFFSLEMPIASVTERYHEIIQGASGRDIEEHYSAKGSGEYRIQIEEAFKQELKNLFTVPSRVSISNIQPYVKLIEKEYKIKIGVIGIDYLGLMDGPGEKEYEIVSRIARDTKTMAKNTNLPIIILSQTSRDAGGSGDKEISLTAGRGSGAIEESADVALGLFQDKDDLICKILKNRKGPKGSRWKLDLTPDNLRIGRESDSWEPPKKKKKKDLDY